MRKYYLIGVTGIILLSVIGFLLYTSNGSKQNSGTEGGGAIQSASPAGEGTGAETPAPSPSQTSGSASKTSSKGPTVTISKSQGRVIFALKDEFVSIDQIDSILFTVNEIQVQSPTKGWITVMTGPRVYDLVQIYKSGTEEFLAETLLDQGTYNQMKMSVGAIRVIQRGETIAEEVKLPSGELKIPARLQTAKGENSSVEIDMLSEKSLHTATDGKFIFLPVVRVETKSNVTSFQVRQNMVTVIGGTPVYDATFGMDENGNVKDGYRLNPSAKLEISGDKIKIVPQ